MKLPPLNALRAFDAVARHGSVRLAAQELFVTPAAVSQQIRQLEEHLEVRLFERRARQVDLTETGRSFHLATSKHLRAIAMAAERVRPGKQTVMVTSIPSFAARWLVPRLPVFTAEHPNTEVRVDANPAVVDLTHSDCDLALREGAGRYRGTESRLLFELNVLPVATPGYLKELFGRGGRGWAGARLLHESMYSWWPQWFEMNGIAGIDTTRGLYFSHTMLALTAALQGQGVALTPRFLVEEELGSRALSVVDARELVTGSGYYLVWPLGNLRPLSEAATAFRDWVIAEAARTRDSLGPPASALPASPASMATRTRNPPCKPTR